MTFDERIGAIGERFLSDRSYRLIVAPALADFQFDGCRRNNVGSYAAVFRALAGAALEDVTHDASTTFTFLALAFIPAVYYAFLFILCAPSVRLDANNGSVLVLGAVILLLSTAPAVICYWPDPLPAREPGDEA